jgi:type II secretory pathway component PulK
MWVGIFHAFFASFKIDPEVVDALIAWITPYDTGGAERSYYERLPVPYKPPGSRMRTPGELRLVKGLDNAEELAKLFPGLPPDLPPEAVADLDLGSNPYLTPFGAEQPQHARVNLNTAAPEVLTALITGVQPGGSAAETIVQDMVARRQEKQFKNLTQAVQQDPKLRQALGKVADVKSQYFRVESVGVVGIVQKKIVAVFKRDQQPATPPNPRPQNILYFKVE